MKWSADSLVLWQQLTKWHLLTSGDTRFVRIKCAHSLADHRPADTRITFWHVFVLCPPNFLPSLAAREMHPLGAYDDMTAEPLLNHILAAECPRTPHRRHRWIRKRFSSEYFFSLRFLGSSGPPAGWLVVAAADAFAAAATHAAPPLPAASLLDRSFKSPTIAAFCQLFLCRLHRMKL